MNMTSDDSAEISTKGWQKKVTLQCFKRYKVPSKNDTSLFVVDLTKLEFDTDIYMHVLPIEFENEVEVSLAYEKHLQTKVEDLIATIEETYTISKKAWK